MSKRREEGGEDAGKLRKAKYLARLDPYARFKEAFGHHVNTNWNINGFTETMRVPMDIQQVHPGEQANCSLDIIACDQDLDCTAKCLPRTDGLYKCRFGNDPQNKRGVCLFDGIKMPACNYERGGLLMAVFDTSLREVVYTCVCTQPEVWSGPGCNTQNPFFCSGGGIAVKADRDFEWNCMCQGEDKILIRIRKLQYQYESRNRFICVSKDVYDNFLATDKQQVQMVVQ